MPKCVPFELAGADGWTLAAFLRSALRKVKIGAQKS
jgi:hypothetical protein